MSCTHPQNGPAFISCALRSCAMVSTLRPSCREQAKAPTNQIPNACKRTFLLAQPQAASHSIDVSSAAAHAGTALRAVHSRKQRGLQGLLRSHHLDGSTSQGLAGETTYNMVWEFISPRNNNNRMSSGIHHKTMTSKHAASCCFKFMTYVNGTLCG